MFVKQIFQKRKYLTKVKTSTLLNNINILKTTYENTRTVYQTKNKTNVTKHYKSSNCFKSEFAYTYINKTTTIINHILLL